MTHATLHSYIMLCKLYGWQSSISGLYWYNRDIQLGLRNKWARRGIHAGKAGFVPPPPTKEDKPA